MALVGEPGSGKSTLLQEARRRADDMLVLRCVGVPWEAELPYSGLHELLRPIADDLSVLPQPQAEALGRALSARNDGPVHAMHLYAGALSLVLERTRQRPVLLIADDVQWIDEPTRQALAFIARRTNAEAVAVLGAAREVFTPGWVDAELCELTPLTECEVAALAEARLGSPLPAAAVTDLADAAHGNPLAVVEAVRRFGSELARRGAGLDDPLSVGDVIGDAYEERLAALSEAAVTVLELLALSYSDDVAIIQRALDAIGVPWTALVEAEGAGIVTVQDGHATFAHPLLRSLVFDRSTPDARRRCHAAFAAVDTLDDDLRLWHAAGAATARDEELAASLSSAAKRFSERGGLLAAAQALHRAAQLTPGVELRVDRLLEASDLAHRAGHSAWSCELSEQALAQAPDEERRVRAEYYLASTKVYMTPGHDACAVMNDLVERTPADAQDLRALIISTALIENIVSGGCDGVREVLDSWRHVELSKLSVQAREDLLAAVGALLVYLGGPDAIDGRELLVQSAQRRLELNLPRESYIVEALIWVDEYDLAERLAQHAATRAERSADAFTGVSVGGLRAMLAIRVGEWEKASACLDLAHELARGTHRTGHDGWFLFPSSMLWAARGERERIDDIVRLTKHASDYGWHEAEFFGNASLGLIELAHGRARAAVEHLRAAADFQFGPEWPDPNPLSWPLDLVEALVLTGEIDGAVAAAEDLRAMAGRSLRSWLKAAVPMADGLVAGDDAFEAPLQEAIAAFEAARAPFERARARLWLGRRRIRVGLADEAREPLQAALAEFERLGTEPWAAQARRELGAPPTPRRRRRAGDDPDVLTAQERQVAELVARGATNKEAAGELFLSPKTVESHLSRIYRKLGVSSRTQLAARWQELDAASREG